MVSRPWQIRTLPSPGSHKISALSLALPPGRSVTVGTKVTLLLWSLVPAVTAMQDCKLHIFSIYKAILTHILKS